MLKIKNGIVTVNGIETRNPELIGLAVLDSISNDTITDEQKTELKQRFEDYISCNGLRVTPQRKKLLSVLLSMTAPTPVEFAQKVAGMNITVATAYNFINLCKRAGIIEQIPEQYYFNVNLTL